MRALCERIRETVPTDAPLIIAGDFNDWRHKADRMLVGELGVVDVFKTVTGRPARTFPSVLPVFHLDRIYARGLAVADAHVHLRLSGGAHLRPRGAGRDFRGTAAPLTAAHGEARQSMNRFTPGNAVELLRSGAEYFPALIGAIAAATREVWLETYIFADDRAGDAVDGGADRARPRAA